MLSRDSGVIIFLYIYFKLFNLTTEQTKVKHLIPSQMSENLTRKHCLLATDKTKHERTEHIG